MNALGRIVGRRWVVRQIGVGGVLGFAVLTLAACSDGPSTRPSGGPTQGSSNGLAWNRVDLGFVSAYILVRGSEAAVVDTGVSGSEGAIDAVLKDTGLDWRHVAHVVLTHRHPDHVGSLGPVLDLATAATAYIGAADLAAVESPRRLQPLADGDQVFGLQVVDTPGHTAGHISVFDRATSVLVAGDALNNNDGLHGSDPQFTQDETAAAASVKKLATLNPSTILVGHGPPVIDGAAEALAQLAAGL